MRKLDDKGFTLVELLIAVCILAIIIVPLLNSFLSSYRMNARSRQTLRATTLAQNEMEIFEKESIKDLTELDEFVYDESANPTGYNLISSSTTDGSYVFKREGITNDESGRAMFDVYIELDPERNSTSGRYYNQNTSAVINMNTISTMDSGIYVQTVQSVSNPIDMDTEAYQWFKDNQLASSSWPFEFFATDVKREIVVDISQYDITGKTFTVAKVIYNYTLNNASVMPSEYFSYTPVEQVFFDNTNQIDNEGNPVELKNLYLFYAPRLNASQNDRIVIKNEKGLPVNVYVVRQDILRSGAVSTDDIAEVPLSYQAELEIHDKLTDGHSGAAYYTNLNINETEAVGLGKQIKLKLFNSGVAYDPGTYTRNDIIEKTGLAALDAAAAKDRIYTMKVSVYTTGADINTEAPLVTLTGTKLE